MAGRYDTQKGNTMADENKSTSTQNGTHIIEPDTGAATKPELVKRTVNNHEIEVSPELAGYLDEQKTYYADLQTKHQGAMEEAKVYREDVKAKLKTDKNFYKDNSQKAWDSYIPLVDDDNGGYKGDPALLGLDNTISENDTDGEPDTLKQKAMTPDKDVQERANIRKEIDDLKLQFAKGEGQKTLSVMDSVLADSKLQLAKRTEVLAEVKDYYNRTGGQQPTKQVIKGFAQASHDSTKELNDKAGYVLSKPRYEGASPSGGMPKEKITGIPGDPFGSQAEKDESTRALADKLDGIIY